MRICYYSSANSLQGGAELSQVRIVTHLLSNGHEVHIVLPRQSELTRHYQQLGAKVHVLYWQHLTTLANPLHIIKYLFWLPIVTLRLAMLLRKERIEVLHVNELLDFQGLAAARLARVPCVTWVRYVLPDGIMRRTLNWIILTLADRVICNCHSTHRLALNNSPSPKIGVIHNGGPDTSVFDPSKVVPRRPEGAGDALLVGQIAKLVEEKGHHLFLEMAHRLTQLGHDKVCYVIVGGPVAGHEAYAQKLRDMVRQFAMEDRVFFVGQQRDVASWVAGMDIVCHLPVCHDTFPYSPMEGAVMGKPVLSVRAGGIPESLTDPDSCRLVEMGNVDAMVQAITPMLESPELRARLGEAGRQEILTKRSVARHLEQVTELYRSMIVGYNPQP